MSAAPTQLPTPAADRSEPRRTVLVVDDDPTTRLLVDRLLSNQGFAVVQVGRLKDAREVLAKQRIALVLVDGLLPDGTGFDLIAELRKTPDFKVPVVFLSSFYKDFKSYKALSEELQVAGILHKPINPASLVEQVNRAILPAVPTSAST